ncbi:hypothetical protein WMA07_002635 [Klebsiella aerogenes]
MFLAVSNDIIITPESIACGVSVSRPKSTQCGWRWRIAGKSGIRRPRRAGCGVIVSEMRGRNPDQINRRKRMCLFELLAAKGVKSFFYFPDEASLFDGNGRKLGTLHHKEDAWVIYQRPLGPALEVHKKAIMIADLESYADIGNKFRCHKIVVDISGKFFLLVLLGCTVDVIEART